MTIYLTTVTLEKYLVSFYTFLMSNLGVMELDCKDPKGQELIKKITEAGERLPDFKVLSIRFLEEDNDDIKYLLSNCIEVIQSFFFNNHVLPDYRFNKIDIGNYMEAIITVLPRVSKEVYFYYMKINSKQLAR